VTDLEVPANDNSGRATDRDGYVYFIGSVHTDLVKIGFSDNPESRLTGLQTGCPVPLEILAKLRGRQSMERALHAAFADERRHGEWFYQTPRLRYLVMLCQSGLGDVAVDRLVECDAEPFQVMLPARAARRLRHQNNGQRTKLVGAIRRMAPPVGISSETVDAVADLLDAMLEAIQLGEWAREEASAKVRRR
jgi:hypothetical protein